MPSINNMSHKTLCMRSEIVDHDRKFEWIIAGVSKFKVFSPYTITSKEFKLATECGFRLELDINVFMESIIIKINRKDDLDREALMTRSISLQNSEGETYVPPMPTSNALVIRTGACKQLLHCQLTECFPLKLPNDELTVNIHLKLTNCCLITKEIKDRKLETTASGNEFSLDLPRGCLLQSKNLDMQPTDILLEVGDILLPCHKFILSIRSTFFKKILEEGKLERNSVVKLEDMSSEACQGFMEYIYANNISGVSLDAILELYNVGVKLQIDGLQDNCSSILAESLSEKNVCKIMKLADQHNDTKLKTASSAFILEHMEKLKHSSEFSCFLKDDLFLFYQILSNSFSAQK